MLKQTNLQEIQNVAIAMLYLDIIQHEKYPFIVYHPFFNSPLTPVMVGNKVEFVDITVEENLKLAQDSFANKIKEITSYHSFLTAMNKIYLPEFFKRIYKYLSPKDYSEFLSEMWCIVEFPNNCPDIKPSEFVSFFKKANPEFLMEQDEFKKFQELPDEVTIYRGIQNKSTIKALSWTTNKGVAKWFANRFEQKGTIYQANIKREDILAYFDRRNEKEVVIDFSKIYNIKSIQK